MIKFSKDKVLLLHKLIAQETGGSIGLRDEALLDSALENAFAGFDGQEFYLPRRKRAHGSAIRSSPTTPLWTATSASVCTYADVSGSERDTHGVYQ